MKKLFRIASVTFLLGVIIAWTITIPAFSEMIISTVGRWTFEGNTLDSSGKAHHGTLYGSPLPLYDFNGVHQQGLNFNGSNYMQVADSASLNFGTGDYSISGWVKTTSTKTLNTIIDKRVSGKGPGYHVALYQGTLLFQVADSTGGANFYDTSLGNRLNDGALHSFVITVDQYYSLEIRFYIDGVLTKSFSASSYRGNSSNTSPLYIGKHTSNPVDNFVGMLDEIALYSYMLSSTEINQLFLNGSCCGRWALDGNAADTSGNGNDGSFSGSPLPETVNGLYYLNQALRFNGSNKISIPDSPSLNFGTGDFSISFWVNTTHDGVFSTFIDSGENVGYEVGLQAGQISFYIRTDSDSETFFSDASKPINDGFWHFVTITVDRDNSSGIKIYLDNALSGTFDPTPCQGDISDYSPLYIGRNRNDFYPYLFIGSLDEVKMYKRVLTTSEINYQYTTNYYWRPATYNTYYGHLHNHSEFSLWTQPGAPAAAYAYAKNAGLDFLGVTDHGEELTDSEWNTLKSAARAANLDGQFVALCGFEWSSSGNYGHVAVVSAPDDIPNYISSQNTNYDTFPKLVDWVNTQKAVAFFNHPGRENAQNQEFCHFTSTPSEKFVGMELWNKTDGFNKYYSQGYPGSGKYFYDDALSNKWKIGASGSEDNHSANWGSGPYRLAVLATARTRAAILDALKARRFYSTLDRNLKLTFTINSAPMGASISPGPSYVSIQASDGDVAETFTKVELLKNGVVINTWTSFGSAASPYIGINITLSNGEYYYVRVTEADGGQAISSPIFINY